MGRNKFDPSYCRIALHAATPAALDDLMESVNRLGAQGLEAVVEMGGDQAGSSEGRATETSVRGFWKAWRTHMGAWA